MAETLEVGLNLRDRLTPGLRKSLGSVSRFVRSAREGFARLGRSIFNVRTAIGAIAAGAAVRGLRNLITSTTELDDRIQKLSIRLGLSTEFLSEMKVAGERAGIQFNQLSIGFQRAIRRFEQFRELGKGEAALAFQILGSGIAEAVQSGESFEKLVPRIADAFKNLDSEQQRVLAGFKLFDSEGVSIIQLLGQGSRALDDARESARRLGLSISRDVADASAAFSDQVADMSGALRGLRDQITRALVPELTRLAHGFTELVIENRPAIVEFFREAVDRARTFAKAIIENWPKIVAAFRGVAKVAQTALAPLVRMGEIIEQVTGEAPALERFGTALKGAIDVISVPRTGPKSLFERFFITGEQRTRAIAGAQEVVTGLRREFDDLADAIDRNLVEQNQVFRNVTEALRRFSIDLTALRFSERVLSETDADALKTRFEVITIQAKELREELEKIARVQTRVPQAAVPKVSGPREKPFIGPPDLPTFEPFQVEVPGSLVSEEFGANLRDVVPDVSRFRDVLLEVARIQAPNLVAIGDAIGRFQQARDLPPLFEAMVDSSKRFVDSIKAMSEQDPFQKMLTSLKSVIDEITRMRQPIDVLRNTLHSVVDTIQQGLVNVLEALVDKTLSLKDALRSLVRDIGRQLINAGLGIGIGAIFGGLGFGGGTTTTVVSGGGGGFPGFGGTGGSFQHGAVVLGPPGQPVGAILHPPEFIMPLDSVRGRKAMAELGGGGGQQVVQNITVVAMDAKSLDERVLEAAFRNKRILAALMSDVARQSITVGTLL